MKLLHSLLKLQQQIRIGSNARIYCSLLRNHFDLHLITQHSLELLMSNSIALDSLRAASCGRDVKHVIETYGESECNKAWKELSSIERASLQFANAFQGTIIHNYDHGIPAGEERPRIINRAVERNEDKW